MSRNIARPQLFRAESELFPVTALRYVALLFLFLCANRGLGLQYGVQQEPRPELSSEHSLRPQAKMPVIRFKQTRLKNGLTVIIAPDHSIPAFALAVSYDVGSRDEKPGHTGLAHLLEHMMFQGSKNVGRGEHYMLILNNGGSMNGATSQDHTAYYEMLPKNQLDLGLFLEADRMRSLSFPEKALENQREVVKEEVGLQIENKPYTRSYLAIDEISYRNFAYQHPVRGSDADLSAATIDDLKQLFRDYYYPANATLTLVGDVNEGEALARITKYFGSIPSRPPGRSRTDLTEPAHTREHRETLYDALAPSPQLLMAYHIPPGNTPENYAMTLLAVILGGGHSSRLYQILVQDKQLASELEVVTDSRVGPSQFYVLATPAPGVEVQVLEQALNQELASMATHSVSEAEISKALAQIRRGLIEEHRSILTTARELAEFASEFHNPGLINTTFAKLAAVTPAQIGQQARKFLVPSNRAVVITMPRESVSGQGQNAAAIGEGFKSSTLEEIGSPLLETERLNRAPVNEHLLDIHFQKPDIHNLSNGLTALILEQHKVPTLTLTLWIKPGTLGDPQDLPGLASFTAAMLREGTQQNSSAQISAAMDRIGATLTSSAEFGSSYTKVSVSGLAEDVDALFRLLSELVIYPAFRAADLQRLKSQKIAEMIQLHSQPDFLADERLQQALYGKFPAGVSGPSRESVQRITTADLENFHRQYYLPGNAFLGVTGDVDAKSITEKIDKYFGRWPAGKSAGPSLASIPPASSRQLFLVDRPSSVETSIAAGNLSVRRTDPDFY